MNSKIVRFKVYKVVMPCNPLFLFLLSSLLSGFQHDIRINRFTHSQPKNMHGIKPIPGYSSPNAMEAQLPHQELRRQFGALVGVPCFRLWSSGRTRLRGVADTIFLRRFLVSNYACLTLWQNHAAKLEKVVDEGRNSTCSESRFSNCQFGSWRFATEAD